MNSQVKKVYVFQEEDEDVVQYSSVDFTRKREAADRQYEGGKEETVYTGLAELGVEWNSLYLADLVYVVPVNLKNLKCL